ncbi:MAG TPA: 2-phosphosulfolactate phosphatase [Candidatus Hydrogenedentes bacterium]|nr:2-phosphosulfolactate phosphatase [Candidatus Hydrogenedentota bacterium]
MYWHIIEGEAGCRFAVEHQCVAIVVDALRASATAAMLLHHGATEIWVVGEVHDAFAAKKQWPDALLFGERNGLPPEGFDFGNSPRETVAAKGRRVIFTTTTGAQRMISAWGAAAVYMGTTINASAVVNAALHHEKEAVLIPAGLYNDPAFDAQEDRVAAVAIAMTAGAEIGEGADVYARWKPRIEQEGIETLFMCAPHAEKLRRIHLEADVAFCAQMNVTDAVPMGIEKNKLGVLVGRK